MPSWWHTFVTFLHSIGLTVFGIIVALIPNFRDMQKIDYGCLCMLLLPRTTMRPTFLSIPEITYSSGRFFVVADLHSSSLLHSCLSGRVKIWHILQNYLFENLSALTERTKRWSDIFIPGLNPVDLCKKCRVWFATKKYEEN